LDKGCPWEIERVDVQFPVRFYGTVVKRWEQGKERSVWEGGETIIARAYDTPTPGYMTFNTLALRLWRSLPANEFDFSSFNEGDYFRSLEARERVSQ
jgi:starch phosphorylase